MLNTVKYCVNHEGHFFYESVLLAKECPRINTISLKPVPLILKSTIKGETGLFLIKLPLHITSKKLKHVSIKVLKTVVAILERTS